MGSVRERDREECDWQPTEILGQSQWKEIKDSMSHIHDENGKVLVDEVKVIERWKEHFKGLYIWVYGKTRP